VLSFDAKPSEHPVIALDEGVVKRSGGTHMCLGGCGRTHQATNLVRSETHPLEQQATRSGSSVDRGGSAPHFVGDPVSPQIVIHGPRRRDPRELGSKTTSTRPSGCV